MINIANLLRNAKKGTILWSPLFGPVEFMQLGKNDQIWIKVDNSEPFDKYGRYFGSRFTEAECLLFPSKEIRTWEGWKLPTEPNFKVGDWVVKKNGGTFYGGNYVAQITLKEFDENGERIWLSSTTWVYDDDIRLWTIQDAKDGDVLATDNGWACIFKAFDGCVFSSYCFMDSQKWFCEFGSEAHTLDSSINGNIHPATKEQRELLFAKMREAGYTWDEKKKELRKIIEPNFKVGNWICPINGKRSKQVRVVEVRSFSYLTEDRFGILWPISFSAQHEWRLWLIQDANDGDVLVCYSEVKGNPIEQAGIFKQYVGRYGGCSNTFLAHTGIDWDGDIIINGYMGSTNILPATKEQRDLLFAKLKDEGYVWDDENKELKKNKTHYDIANFHAGMPVLVRDYNNSQWSYVQFSHLIAERNVGEGGFKFNACGIPYIQCIPFEGNESLLGTTEPCDERFINW